jgi:hypothetical protein
VSTVKIVTNDQENKMKSTEHQKHLDTRISHSACSECRADTERRFVDCSVWRYDHVHDYLEYVAPRILAIQNGADGVNAHQWLKDFRKALNRRISLKVDAVRGRKYCDSYLERFRQFPQCTDAGYLRRFASRGASCLDY